MGNEESHAVVQEQELENTVKLTWKAIKPLNISGREGHCSASVQNKLYIFGGVTCTANEVFQEVNDFLCYDAGLF